MLPYYLLCLIFLLSSLSWLLASINVFYRDTSQVVGVILNLWFWLTPIVWDPEMLPKGYEIIFYLNPLAYVIKGYRSALLDPALTFPGLSDTAIFLGITCAIWYLGSVVFTKLKYSFADVL